MTSKMTVKNESYTLKQIENGLRNPHYYRDSARNGNVEALNHLADAQHALEMAEPTEPQLKAVELVWVKEYSLTDAGKILGITPQGVRFNLQLLSVKLQKVVDYWKERENRVD